MKKIALVADVKDWAFDIAAHIIKNALDNQFKIDIYYSKEFDKNLFVILEQLKDYDLIHFFWREILLDFEKQEFKDEVCKTYGDYSAYVSKIVNKISTGIYDHLYEDNMIFNNTFTKYCKKYVVSSQELFDSYNNMNIFKKPTCIMGDSFEKERFYPTNTDRFKFTNPEFIIGWVGNSAWNSKEKDEFGNPIDFKGFNTILKPAVDELISEGLNIKLYCADKNLNPISNDKMNEYYSKIHLYICTSYAEGTPKPLLEAMGCGIPIITTDVGVAKQALGKLQQNYILGKRLIGINDLEIINNLKEKIKYLYNNRNVLLDLSKENIEFSKKYEISTMKNVYCKYFNEF